MIWLSVVAFLGSVLTAAGVLRWAQDHAGNYGHRMPQRFHHGDVPRLGGLAMLVGIALSWGLGRLTTGLGDPSSLHMGAWVLWWLLALLPAVVGGMVEDVTQRLAPRYRLLLSALTAVGRIFLGPLAAWMIARVGWGQFFVIAALASVSSADRFMKNVTVSADMFGVAPFSVIATLNFFVVPG